MCLLFLLHQICENFGFEVGACHVHHGIREKEADDDLDFCKNFCQERNIPFFCEKLDVPSYCKKNALGLEEGARILRYEALNRVAKAQNYNKIATAHSASDQAETILFRLIRGSGFNGMCGIPLERDSIIRPLLPFYKNEIRDFLDQQNLSCQFDSTNQDVSYARNRMRNDILPQLQNINPSAEKALVRFGSIAKEQSEFVSFLCDRWERENGLDCSCAAIPLKPLTDLVSQKEMIPIFREAISRMGKKEKIVIDFQHFNALRSLLKQPVEGKIIEISKDFSFCIANGQLCLRRSQENETGLDSIDYQVKLQIGDNPLSNLKSTITVTDKRVGKVVNVNKKLLIIHLAFDKIKGDLFVRNRKDGDAIQVDGMTKSLKKLFQEAKVPVLYRNTLPLVCDDEGILWIPYVGLCDRVRNSENDEIFTIQLSGEYFPEIE